MRALLIALLLSSGAIAEPSPEVKYLMNEPMTMWDWGIYRLENVLEDNLDGLEARYPWITSPNINILYNWDSNRLSIIASATFNQPRLFEASSTFNLRLKSDDDFRKIQREACRELIGSMREKLALNGDTGEPNTADGSILFLRFTHTTFTSNDRPENLRKELDNITTLRASFGETKCQSSVSSPKILFEE